MAERAVFLDRDNTLIENDGYLGDPSKVKLLPGAATALAALRSLGYRLIVVSNQSGVARGMFDEAAVEAVNAEMDRQLKQQGAYVDVSYYCPFHPEAVVPEYRVDHEWRKPRPGMLKQAAADFVLELAHCWMIGDQPRDIAAGAAAGCRTILLKDPEHPAAPEANGDTNTEVSPSFVVKSLADAARIVAREGRGGGGGGGGGGSDAAARRQGEAGSGPEPAAAPVAPMAPVAAVESKREVVPMKPANSAAASGASEVVRGGGGGQVMGVSRMERQLEELVALLQRQQRNAELKPDFSKTKFGALVVQMLALLALCVGVFTFLSAKATFVKPDDWYLAILSYERAAIWVLVAMVLEGVVLALMLQARQR